MKKLLVTIQATLIFPFLASPAYGMINNTSVNPCVNTSNIFSNSICGMGNNIAGTIGNIVVVIIVLAVIIALLFLLWGAVKWITSGGDKEKVESSRNHIVAAIIGLVVIFLAIFIVALILGIFGIRVTDLILPRINP